MSNDLGIIGHKHAFVKILTTGLRDRCGVAEGDRLLLAVSGGADSTALLYAMATIAPLPNWSLDLHVAHVNHHLRDTADEDEDFVAECTAALDLPFYRTDIYPDQEDGNLEDVARDWRYSELASFADGLDADYIATGHHADDQLETMLMRLMRGSSVSGMSGIAPKRRIGVSRARLIRPMLWTDHFLAIGFLRAIKQPWREDETNQNDSRWRARLRKDVLPVLRELREDAAVKAAESADRMRDATNVIEQIVRNTELQLVQKMSAHEAVMQRYAAAQLLDTLLGGVIRLTSVSMGASADALSTRVIHPILVAIRAQSGERRSFDLNGGVRIIVTPDHVRWTRAGH